VPPPARGVATPVVDEAQATRVRHRDRVIAALSHEEPDRCPMQISFTPEFADRLRADLETRGLVARSGPDIHNPHGGGNTYELELALDEDLILTSVGWANSYYQGPDEYIDEWGVTWRAEPYETPFGTGHYTEVVGRPLAGDAAIASYRAPDPDRPELYEEAGRVIRQLGGEYYIVGVTASSK
jgi:uroporphyrinogen decarboxylase